MTFSGLVKASLVGWLICVASSIAAQDQKAMPEQNTRQQQAPHDQQESSGSIEKPNPEDLKHGAVLCVWRIYLGMRKIEDACYAGQDEEFKAVLDKEIARMDRFIIDNSPVTRDQLERLKQNLSLATPSDFCSDTSRRFYENFRKIGAEKIDQGVTDLLSVPRKPVLNPCL